MASSSKYEFEKRISKLSEENQELQGDLHVLTSTLGSHHNREQRDVRARLRKEIGGSIWEHGHTGSLHNYRSQEAKAAKSTAAKSHSSKDTQSMANSTRDRQPQAKTRPSSGKKVRQESKSMEVGPSLESLGPSVSKIGHQRKEVRTTCRASSADNKSIAMDKAMLPQRGSMRDANEALSFPVLDDEEEEDHPHGSTGRSSSVKLNETYTKESMGQVAPFLLPSPDHDSVSPSARPTGNKNRRDSEKRAKVLKKMIKKLDIDMKLGEYRTSETDSDSLSTPRHQDSVSLASGRVKSPRFCDPDVMAWLLNHNLKDTEKYARIFAEHEVDMVSLVLMTESQLREMGVCALGALSKLVNAIELLRASSRKLPPQKATARSDNGVVSPKSQNGGYNHPAPYKLHSSKVDEERSYKPYRRTPESNKATASGHKNGADKSLPSSQAVGAVTQRRGVSASSTHPKTARDADKHDKKGASNRRPQSAVVGPSFNSQPSTKHRPHTAGKTDRNGSSRSSSSRKGSQDLVESPDNVPSKENPSSHGAKELREAALNELISVRSLGAARINGTQSPVHTSPQTDPEVHNSTSGSPESRLLEVETQIQELQRELTSPTAMEIIMRLQGQIREIQKEILVSRTSETFQRNGDSPPRGDRSSRPQRSRRAGSEPQTDSEVEVVHPTPKPSRTDPAPPQAPVPRLSTTTGPTTTVASMSMSKTELMRNYRREKDAHRKQIRHLESELDRLKHKDPVRTCEIQEQDIQYSSDDKIGEGAFSEVFRGSYQGSEIAVKRLKVPLSSQDKNYFAAEVSLLRELRHPRVVLLLGVCTGAQLPLMVLEYLSLGSLYLYLHDSHSPPLDHAAYYQVAKDTALGMNYLHRHQPPVLHLDLKSMNVLLTSHLRAKIADFGFSKLRHDADQMAKKQPSPKSRADTHVKGTPAWMAPELLNTGDVSTKADVYSYSIILWEMLTRRHPYQGCTVFQVIERTRSNKRPEIPGSCPTALRDLIARCWHNNPARRPSFKDIIGSLDRLQLPEDWRTLFLQAGVPATVLEDVESTRTLIDLVSLTLDGLEVPPRPPGVPTLQLDESQEAVDRDRWRFLQQPSDDEEWDDVSEDEDSDGIVYGKSSRRSVPEQGQQFNKQEKPSDVPSLNLNLSGDQKQIKAAKTFRKSGVMESKEGDQVQDSNSSDRLEARELSLKPPSYVPPPPPPVPSMPGLESNLAQNKKTKNVKFDVRESFMDQLKFALKDRPLLGDPVVSDDAIKPTSDTLRPSGDLDLRASQLLAQKQRLRSIQEPHPCQLSDLTEVPQETIKNLCDILKKAVSSRRMHMQQGDSMDRTLTGRTWSEDST